MDGRTLFHLLVLRPLLRLVFGLHVQGAGQLEAMGQFVIVANHNSHLDALLLMSVLPRRHLGRTHPVAAADHFGRSRRLSALMDRVLAPVWVDRVGNPGAALDEMSRRVGTGASLILFPEGTRGEPGELAPFHSGIGRLLERHPGLPVIPAHILGPERALPRGAALPLPIWNRVLLGPAQHLSGPPRDLTDALRATVDEIGRAERARRQTRRLRRRDTFTVATVGIDGSGKSTLACKLATALSRQADTALIGDELRLLAAGEPRPLQPLATEQLRQRLSRRAKRARSLAGYKIPKLAELLLRNRLLLESRRWHDPGWAVMDGSPLLNLTAWTILYREEVFDPEFCLRALCVLSGRQHLDRRDLLARRVPELRWLQRLGLTRLGVPDAVVFLELPAGEAMRRIETRGESMQVHETEEKLGTLQLAYRAVCEVAAEHFGMPVLRLDGSGDPEALAEAAVSFVTATRGERCPSEARQRNGTDASK